MGLCGSLTAPLAELVVCSALSSAHRVLALPLASSASPGVPRPRLRPRPRPDPAPRRPAPARDARQTTWSSPRARRPSYPRRGCTRSTTTREYPAVRRLAPGSTSTCPLVFTVFSVPSWPRQCRIHGHVEARSGARAGAAPLRPAVSAVVCRRRCRRISAARAASDEPGMTSDRVNFSDHPSKAAPEWLAHGGARRQMAQSPHLPPVSLPWPQYCSSQLPDRYRSPLAPR